MDLNELVNYRKEAVFNRMLLTGGVLACLSLTLYMYIDSRAALQDAAAKKVVIDRNNNAWIATERGITEEEQSIQFGEHIKDFCRLFYAFDGATYDSCVNRSLDLIEGDAGKALFVREYVEGTLGEQVRQNNWKLTVSVSKVNCLANNDKGVGIIQFVQTLERPAGMIKRRITAEFEAEKAGISHANPRGALITKFVVKENVKLK